jgi:hypothetical protein
MDTSKVKESRRLAGVGWGLRQISCERPERGQKLAFDAEPVGDAYAQIVTVAENAIRGAQHARDLTFDDRSSGPGVNVRPQAPDRVRYAEFSREPIGEFTGWQGPKRKNMVVPVGFTQLSSQIMPGIYESAQTDPTGG